MNAPCTLLLSRILIGGNSDFGQAMLVVDLAIRSSPPVVAALDALAKIGFLLASSKQFCRSLFISSVPAAKGVDSRACCEEAGSAALREISKPQATTSRRILIFPQNTDLIFLLSLPLSVCME